MRAPLCSETWAPPCPPFGEFNWRKAECEGRQQPAGLPQGLPRCGAWAREGPLARGWLPGTERPWAVGAAGGRCRPSPQAGPVGAGPTSRALRWLGTSGLARPADAAAGRQTVAWVWGCLRGSARPRPGLWATSSARRHSVLVAEARPTPWGNPCTPTLQHRANHHGQTWLASSRRLALSLPREPASSRCRRLPLALCGCCTFLGAVSTTPSLVAVTSRTAGLPKLGKRQHSALGRNHRLGTVGPGSRVSLTRPSSLRANLRSTETRSARPGQGSSCRVARAVL